MVSPRFHEITRICEKHGIALMCLFGSQADAGLAYLEGKEVHTGDDPLADLDIGVVFLKGLPKEDTATLYASIYNDLGDVFFPFVLDLSFLEENHSVFQAEALTGICVYAVNEEFRERYTEDVLRRAADFKPFWDRYLDEYLEGVLNHGQ